MGTRDSHVPLAYWNRSSCGRTDVSRSAACTPEVRVAIGSCESGETAANSLGVVLNISVRLIATRMHCVTVGMRTAIGTSMYALLLSPVCAQCRELVKTNLGGSS